MEMRSRIIPITMNLFIILSHWSSKFKKVHQLSKLYPNISEKYSSISSYLSPKPHK